MPEMTAGDRKLVQYLNEAYGTEKRLETALQAHIAMTVRPPYKKRLKEHLSETKRHAREVKQAIKRLGGEAATVSAPGPSPVADAAQVVVGGAQKAVALVQGPLHALRGTGEQEKQLKNAKTEYSDEAEEIATYTAIEALAAALGDREIERLARSIRREEERMSSFLAKEITLLSKAVAKAEVPASQRAGTRRAKASGSTRKAKAKPAKAKAPARKAKPAARKAVRSASAKARPAAGKAKAKAAAGSSRRARVGAAR